MHGTAKFMMADQSTRNQMIPSEHGALMPADLSLLNNMYSSKITSAQKKKGSRSKSKQNNNMSHEVCR